MAFWRKGKAPVDEEKVKAQREAKERLRFLLEFGLEEEYVEFVKAVKPGMSPEELRQLILKFRELRRPSGGD